MPLRKRDKILEEVAVLLLSIPGDEDLESLANDAAGLAFRAKWEWWTLPGKPYFQERLQSLKRRMEQPQGAEHELAISILKETLQRVTFNLEAQETSGNRKAVRAVRATIQKIKKAVAYLRGSR